MARTGMTDLIGQIRVFCNLGTNDYTLGTSTFWSDDNVQTVLDRHKVTVIEDELLEVPNTISGGSIEYKIFHSRFGNFEQTTGGTAIFTIEDSAGTIIGTSNYTVDYANGIVTFGSNQAGSSRYLTGYSYDIYNTAADVWRMKAGAYGESVNFKTDNMSVNRGDLIKNALSMASQYSMMGNSKVIDMIRDDSL